MTRSNHFAFKKKTTHSSLHITGWTSEPQPQTRSRVFNCRFLVKPPDDKDETMEEKQQRVSKYESMQISSVLLPSNAERLESGDVSSESDISPCLLCIARRIPLNEKPIGTPVEQFTIKLDTAWKIIGVDLSWLSPGYNYLTKVRMRTTMSYILITVTSIPIRQFSNNWTSLYKISRFLLRRIVLREWENNLLALFCTLKKKKNFRIINFKNHIFMLRIKELLSHKFFLKLKWDALSYISTRIILI